MLSAIFCTAFKLHLLPLMKTMTSLCISAKDPTKSICMLLFDSCVLKSLSFLNGGLYMQLENKNALSRSLSGNTAKGSKDICERDRKSVV